MFPPFQRLVFPKNPLAEVICQLRFSAILRIEADPPVTFQDALRADFPEYTRATRAHLVLGSADPPLASSVVHQLLSRDATTRITLSSDSLSVSTTSYRTWEEFRRPVDAAIDALVTAYGTGEFSRVGLRYRDHLAQSALGLSGRDWSQYVREELIGLLRLDAFRGSVVEQVSQVLLRAPGAMTVRIMSGLVPSGEPDNSFFLDFDVATTDLTRREAIGDILDSAHELAGGAFYWATTDTLRQELLHASPAVA